MQVTPLPNSAVGERQPGTELANPSAYYVNIHSTVYPAGAIRTQLG